MADQAGVMNINDRKIEQDDFHRIKSFPEKVSGKEPGGRRQKGGTSRKNGGKRRNKAAERRGNGVMGCYCVYETVFLRFLAAINEPWLVRNSAAVVSSCLWVSCYLSTTLHKAQCTATAYQDRADSRTWCPSNVHPS